MCAPLRTLLCLLLLPLPALLLLPRQLLLPLRLPPFSLLPLSMPLPICLLLLLLRLLRLPAWAVAPHCGGQERAHVVHSVQRPAQGWLDLARLRHGVYCGADLQVHTHLSWRISAASSL